MLHLAEALHEFVAMDHEAAPGRIGTAMRAFLSGTLLLAGLVSGSRALADPAPFDLAGPALRVTVTHQGVTLPIAEVPQLAAGDSVKVRADLPDDQSAHYVLVAAFLRGSTNPPPDKWFYQAESWTKKGRKGLSLTVPDGAQQIVLFLAPATGGDYPTLRNTVQGRPGAFVRAAQDLAQASLDRSRLDTYLTAVRKTNPGDPNRLDRITPLLARTLQVKVNTDCLTKTPELQAACLLQDQESLVLNDGHSNAITEAVAGPGADLALQLSATPQGGLGYYSPYIAAIRDIIGIFSSIHTAKYQYIPALATLSNDRMGLVLNAPPSFHNPKSVLVTALPIVAPVHVPPLQVANQAPSLCAQAPELLLPISGAPLIYATRYAHDLSLRVRLPNGRSIDLPATPDAERGGLVIQTQGKLPADLKVPLDASLHGIWGFQPFDGPSVRLQPAQPGQWRLPPGAATAPNATVTLTGGTAACVSGVSIQSGGTAQPVSWTAAKSDEIRVTLPAIDDKSGATTLEITGPAGLPPDRLTIAGPPPPGHFGTTLIARSMQRPPATAPVAIKLGSDSEVPSDGTLAFSLRANKGARFTGREKVEVATASGDATATLSPSNGLTLADPQVAIAIIQPAKALGASAFGPIRARVSRDGVEGDWLPLGTLVRLPSLHQLTCPPDASMACELTGDGLFLISALSATPGFEHPTAVPEGYPGNAIQVPHPVDGKLYVRLHDDPDTVSNITG
ncbi:MAG TPA: hypothetical protein VKQ27_06305 [Acetobacteraceae bacterium]|nr:hypothetical protein [Acetobacteraceae bacterium]